MSACRQRGLSLVEILIVLLLITVLMALSLPMFSHANATARSVICRQNLADIGSAVTGYIRDYGHMPEVSELPPHRPGLSLPELVMPRMRTPDAVYCPSDETDRSQLLGTSYRWASAYNGMEVDEFEAAVDKPLVTDREGFHAGTDLTMNELVLRRAAGKYQFVVTGSDTDTAPREPSNREGGESKDKDKTNNRGNGKALGRDKDKGRPETPGDRNSRRGDDDDDDDDD